MAWKFEKGLQEIGNGQYAYLLPDGSWGYSNAGLVIDHEESLLVDTLFDEDLTAEMLRTMREATGIGGDEITTLVNTHANGDHTFGNRLVHNAEIIASKASAEEMDEMPPETLAAIVKSAPMLGEDIAEFAQSCFGDFNFEGVTLRMPTKTFSGEMYLKVGDKDVHLKEVGPAHTRGDVLIHIPGDKVIYTGDILFIDGTPIMWAGPVGNWLNACDYILGLDVDVIVPGHGPITDKNGVRKMRAYLDYVNAETRMRYAAGMTAEEAAFDIALGDYSSWADSERIVATVDAIYKEINGDDSPPNALELFSLMAKLRKRRR